MSAGAGEVVLTMHEIRCRIECRADDTRQSPGRLYGRLLTYGERAADRPEVFTPGALSWPADGVLLRRQHARAAPIMRVTPERRGDAIVIDAPLPDTAAGRDAAVEVRGGTLAGLSVEFRATREGRRGGVREIQAAELTGAGLVDEGAYRSATVELRGRGGRRRLWL